MKTLRKTLCLILVAAFLGACFVISPSAAASYKVGVPVTFGQTEARKILPLINEMRTGEDAWYYNSDGSKYTCNDLSPLSYSYTLEKLAMQRAAEIALSFSHTRPNGLICFSVFNENGLSYYNYGENIAAGSATAAATNMQWREDNEDYSGQGHRRNMLSDSFNIVGIGHARYNNVDYWVEIFALTDNVNEVFTEANDGKLEKSVEIAADKITAVNVDASPSEITAKLGKTVPVPEVSVTLSVADNWPGRKCIVNADAEISIEDEAVAKRTDDGIVAEKLGATVYKVSVFGKTYSFPITSVCEHNYVEAEHVKSTCTEPGSVTYVCSNCGDTYSETVKVLGHKLKTTKVSPTCTANGKTTQTCLVCGYTHTESIKAKGHKVVKFGKTKKAGYFSKGSVQGTKCKVCGKVIKKPRTLAKLAVRLTGHSDGDRSTKFNWRKASGATGYKVQYGTNKSFKKAKTVTTKVTSKLFKNLKPNTNYYFRVRAFKKSGSRTIYSSWSKTETVYSMDYSNPVVGQM